MDDLKSRVPSYLSKQDKVHKEKRKELEDLKAELLEYKKGVSDIFSDSKVTDYNVAISKLSREYQSVILSRFLDLEDSTKAVAYFLSKVYGVSYNVHEFLTTLYKPVYPSFLNPNYNKPEAYDYNICFLATDDKVDDAYNELSSRFNVSDVNDFDSCYRVKDGLRQVSDNYILLAYYKGSMKDKKIEYTYNNFVSVSDVPDLIVISQLCDERFACILDFIDKVIEYKLDNFGKNISFDDMKKIADSFDVKTLKKNF
jgi:hypothetical protein